MKNTQIYLLKLNSPSNNGLRLWTGNSLHMLRHCSVTEIGNALVKMQGNVEALQKRTQLLQEVKEEFASVSTVRAKDTMEQDNKSSKRSARSKHWPH